MKTNRKLIIALAAVLAVIAIMAGIFIATRPETAQGAKTLTVNVTHKDGSTKTFTYRTDEAYVGPALVKEGLISGTEGEYGLRMDIVDGEKAVWEEDKAYWAIYVNGEYGLVGIDQTPAVDGDVIGLVYTVG